MNGYIQEFECWLQLITDNKNITSGCLSFVNDYWKCSFKDWLHKLCQCYYHSVNMGYIITSIYSEVENSQLKRSALETRPNHTIDVAQDAITNVSIAVIDSVERESSVQLTSSVTKKKKGSSHVVNSDNVVDALCNKAKGNLQHQYEMSFDYHVICYTDTLTQKTFMVRKSLPAKYHTSTIKRPSKEDIPKLWRTRVVTIDKNNICCCDCHFYTRRGCACRHIYAVINTGPKIHHCTVDKLKVYESFFGTNQKFTEEVNEMMKSAELGIHLSPSELHFNSTVRNLNNKPLEWFEAGRQWCLVPGTQTYVDKNDQSISTQVSNVKASIDTHMRNGYKSISTITNKGIFQENYDLHKAINDSITNDEEALLVNRTYLDLYHKIKLGQAKRTGISLNNENGSNALFSSMPHIETKN